MNKQDSTDTETLPESNQNGRTNPVSQSVPKPQNNRSEMGKIKEDISAIKDSIERLTQIMSYKKTCTVCSWNR